MSSIVFGLIAMCIGLWGMVAYWWYVVDVFLAILPVILLFGGFIALMAGIKKTGIRTKLTNGSKKTVEDDTITEKR
ncbi:MAG: hypothetical protein HQL10_05560 [Nitrospirae bacterium]|uniref:Magnetosome protein MamI n=1 Tax=uncultured Nitrospirota bacterium TaxID=170969 RepID=A0A142BTV5_9BACT|nr:magnetosome protein MamI [uncultured Nitrospirota bacterium]MBF0328603.1 hypothetical protein [Nitrospirota bacterium]